MCVCQGNVIGTAALMPTWWSASWEERGRGDIVWWVSGVRNLLSHNNPFLTHFLLEWAGVPWESYLILFRGVPPTFRPCHLDALPPHTISADGAATTLSGHTAPKLRTFWAPGFDPACLHKYPWDSTRPSSSSRPISPMRFFHEVTYPQVLGLGHQYLWWSTIMLFNGNWPILN